MYNKQNMYYLSFSIFFAALTFLTVSLDPDMFWHINNGKTILNHGILDVNIQSYSQGYFISHSWLYDILLYGIFSIFGYVGLKVLSSIFIISSLFFTFKLIDKHKPNLFLLFIIFGTYYFTIVGFLEVRPQQLSLFLTVLIIYLIEFKQANPIYLFIIGAIFSNVHGGAIIQLFTILAIYILADVIKIATGKEVNKEILKNILLSIIAIAISSFINPYGKEILLYPFKNLSNGVMESYISEWLPLIDKSRNVVSIFYFFLLALVLASMSYSRKASVEDILFSSFALMSAMIYRRMYLLAIILNIIFGYRHLEYAIKDILNKFKIKENRYLKVFNNSSFRFTILFLSLVFFITSVGKIDFERNIEKSTICPKSIIQYIEDNNIDIYNNVTLNHFNFGGYLQFRGYKTFVDGRADAFLSTYGNNEPILEDYIKIINERIPEKTMEWIDKYNIKYFIFYSKDFISKNADGNSMQEYLEYSNIATTLFDDGKYVLMETIN